MDIDYRQIADEVKKALAGKGMSLRDVAHKFGLSPQAISNQLSGRPFSRKMAKLYADEFGFDENYLLSGKGSLYGEKEADEPQQSIPNGVVIPHETLQMYTSMADTINRLSRLVENLTTSASVAIKRGIGNYSHNQIK